MTQFEEGAESGTELPETLIRELEQSDDEHLREIIHFAQELLHERHDPTTALEAREGEEILRTTDHGAYKIVIVKRTEQTGQDEGPFAYRVKFEPGLDDGEGEFRWHYLGRVMD